MDFLLIEAVGGGWGAGGKGKKKGKDADNFLITTSICAFGRHVKRRSILKF